MDYGLQERDGAKETTEQEEKPFSGFRWDQLQGYTEHHEPSLYEEYESIFAVRGRNSMHSSHSESFNHDDRDDIHLGNNDIPFQSKVYVFAGKYLIAGLQGLALQKIRLDLNEDRDRYNELVLALDYAYTHTERKIDCNDELRQVLVAFAATEAKALYSLQPFRDLLAKHNDLAVDMGCAIAPFTPSSRGEAAADLLDGY